VRALVLEQLQPDDTPKYQGRVARKFDHAKHGLTDTLAEYHPQPQREGKGPAAKAGPKAAPAGLRSAEACAPEPLGPRGIEDLPWPPMQKLTTDR
jgi:hypothetical protein